MVSNTRIPTLGNTIQQMGVAFVSNAIVLYAMDKLNIDEMIVNGYASEEMKALQLSVLFVIVQEISYKLIHMYMKY